MAELVPGHTEPTPCPRHGHIDDCGSGNTTRLLEEAIRLLGELDEDECVVVTGAHTRWLLELEHRFKATGLVGVKFIPYSSILAGKLRGCRGILLIDDPWDLTGKQEDILYLEARMMRVKSRSTS